MKKLIIEIPNEIKVLEEGEESTALQLEDGDFEVITKLAEHCSLYIEFGAPHSNQQLADLGVAECFAIDVRQFNVRIEEVP